MRFHKKNLAVIIGIVVISAAGTVSSLAPLPICPDNSQSVINKAMPTE